MYYSDEDQLITELMNTYEEVCVESVKELQHAKDVEFCRQFGIDYDDPLSPMEIIAKNEALEKQRASGIASATSIPEKSPFLWDNDEDLGVLLKPSPPQIVMETSRLADNISTLSIGRKEHFQDFIAKFGQEFFKNYGKEPQMEFSNHKELIPMHQARGNFLFRHPQVAEFGVETKTLNVPSNWGVPQGGSTNLFQHIDSYETPIPDENPDLNSENSTGKLPAKRLTVAKNARPLYLQNWLRRYKSWNNEDGILGLHYLKETLKQDEVVYTKRLVEIRFKLNYEEFQRNFDITIDFKDEMGDLPARKSAITKKRKKSPLPPFLEPWLNKFKAWKDSNRAIALKMLISNLNSTHIIYMKRSLCPSEVTTSISSFVSLSSMSGCSFQTSSIPLLMEQSSSTTSKSHKCQAKGCKSPATATSSTATSSTATSSNEIDVTKIQGGRIQLAERRQAGL